MDKEKYEEFSKEMQALLDKYNVSLQVNHGFNVVPREPVENKNETK